MTGDGIEIWCRGFGWGEGVGAGEGYCTSVIDLDSEAFKEEADGFCESGGDYVGKASGNPGGWGVGQTSFSDSIETAGGNSEGGSGF